MRAGVCGPKGVGGMDAVCGKDARILRELAKKRLEHACSEKNAAIMKKWRAQAEGRRAEPIVRMCFSNFENEVVDPLCRCEGATACRIERDLVKSLVGRVLFDDDTPVSPFFEIPRTLWVRPYGIDEKITRAKSGMGFHIEEVVTDLEKDISKLEGGSFGYDSADTSGYFDAASSVIGDILPVRLRGDCLTGPITNPLVMRMGMKNMFLAMYDSPALLHRAMDMACGIYERYYDFLEENSLLLPTADFGSLSQESFCFTDELPGTGASVTRTTECWGFLEAQEATAVSPAAYGEFIYPYLDRLVRRFGLLSYGCCERVDTLWEDYLSKWKNLRKLSVSPFSDGRRVGEYLRSGRVVYYFKPRAEHVTNPGPLDEDTVYRYFLGAARDASGCLFEVAQREVGTIYGDPDRAKRYVAAAKRAIADAWQP